VPPILVFKIVHGTHQAGFCTRAGLPKVAGDHATRTDQRIVTDADTRQDDRATADPDIATDADGAAKFQTGGAHPRVARMIGREDLHRGANLRSIDDADCDDIKDHAVEAEKDP
jgi:hypothetical protein